MARYSLVGVDGNAFAIMGYTARALRSTNHSDLVKQMQNEAMAGDYWNLIAVCDKYIDLANDGLEDDEDDWDDEEEWGDEEEC